MTWLLLGSLVVNALLWHALWSEWTKRRQAERDCKTLRLLCEWAREDRAA